MTYKKLTRDQLIRENEELKLRLADAEKALKAINVDSEFKIKRPALKLPSGEDPEEIKNRYISLYNSMSEGLAIHEIIYDPTGKAEDYIICDVNPAFETITGLEKKKIIGKKATEAYSVITAPYLDIYSEVALTGIPRTFETYFPPMNKHFHVSVFRTDKGIFSTVFQDITERKKSEEKIKQSEQLYRAIGESIDYGIWICDANGKNIYASESYLKLVGMSQKQCSEFGWGDALHPDDAEKTIAAWKECAKSGTIWDIEHRFKGVDGNWHPILARGVPVRDENGKIIFWCGINLDISKIKKTEEELRESQERYHQMFDQHQAVGLVIEPESGDIIDANSAALKYYGYTYKQICSLQIQDINQLPPYEVEAERKKALKEQRNYFVFQHRLANGELRWVEVYSSPMSSNGRQLLYSIIHDITSRKNAEEALRISEERFSRAFKNSPSAITITRLNDGKIIDGNDSVYSLLGYYPGEVVGKTTMELGIWTNSAERLKLSNALLSKGSIQNEEFVLRKKDGTLVPVNLSASLITIEQEQCFISSFIDLTERKLTEETLAFQSKLLSDVSDAVFSSDNNYTITFWNHAAEKIFGWRKDEALGKNSGELLKPIVAGSSPDRERSRLKNEGHWEGEAQYMRKDGSYFFTEVNSTVLKDAEGKVIGKIVVCRDITERKRAEETLKESENKFYTVFHSAPVAMSLATIHDGTVIDVNNAWLNLVKIDRKEDILGKKSYEMGLNPNAESRLKILNEFNQNGYVNNAEITAINREGQELDLLVNVHQVEIAGSKFMLSTNSDITALKIAERALRLSEERLRVTLTSIGDAVITVDINGIVNFLNPVAAALTGWEFEEAEGQPVQNVFRIINEISHAPSENIVKRVLDEGCVMGLANHTALISKDGRNIPIEDSAAPIKDPSGNVIGVILVFHDVTEKRLAQEALRESEIRFRTLAENIPDLIVRFDKNLRFLYGNEAVVKRTGLSLEYLIGKTASEYSAASSSTRSWEEAAKEVFRTGEPKRIEQSNIWQNKPLIYDSLLVPEKDNSGNVTSLVAIARDISEMKKAENILRDSEQRLKYHLENSPLAVVEWDKDFRIIQWSAEAERIFGRKKEEVFGIRIDHLNIIFPEDIPIVEKTSSRLLSGKELKVISQNRNITKSGDVLECIWYNSVLLDENGEMSSVLSLVEDVTLLRKTERDLNASQENYKELVTNARSIILKCDNNGTITFINEFGLDFFGYKKAELLGQPVMLIVPETESTGRDMNEMVENIIESPDNHAVNINENIKKNKEKVWVEWYNKTLFDESGRKTGHIAVGIDITNKKIAEDALKESENKLRSVLNAAGESIYMFDNDGHIIMSNKTGIERLNKTKEDEVIGHLFSEFMTPDLAKVRKDKIRSVFSTGIPLEYEDSSVSRKYYHSFHPVFKDNKVNYVVSYSTDITERKLAEQSLLQSEERFRTIAESLTVMVVIKRASDSRISFVNEPFSKSFGYTKQDLIGKKIPDIYYYPEDDKFLHDLLKIKGTIENMEIKVKRGDGSLFWIMTSFRQIIFNNEPSYLMTSIDISDTKKAQEELLRLNRTLDAQSKSSQALMHATNEKEYLNEVCKIIIEDCGYSMVWVGYALNDEFKSVKPVAYFGFDKGYIEQMNISWGDNDRGRGPTGTAIRTGKPSVCQNMQTDPCFSPWREAAVSRGYSSSIVLPLKSDGKAFGAISIYSKEPDIYSASEINMLAELADDLAYGISFIRLTEYEKEATRAIKENEARLQELVTTKDKFFNIIAHDLKNPFTSLLGASELLYDNIDQMTVDNVKKLSLILNDSAKSGYAILQNLLDWSRSQTGMLKFNPEIVNLKGVIDENIDNLQLQTANKEITLTSELQNDLFITADINMINTVLRNLLSNAVKYTHKNGNILVRAQHKTGEIVMSVKDSGIGIAKEKADKLFKLENSMSLPGTEKEQGTGLGLKLCKEFTEKMGGRIWVESDTDKGSEFKFTIPLNGNGITE